MRNSSIKISTFNVREVNAWLVERRLAKHVVRENFREKNSKNLENFFEEKSNIGLSRENFFTIRENVLDKNLHSIEPSRI